MAQTIAQALLSARMRLAAADFEPSLREANLLLSRILGWTEAELLAHGSDSLDAPRLVRFQELLERRLTGEPIAYILGEKEFFGRSFRVDNRVLIPRPETEHLVEAALELDLPTSPRILDIGTGSGCLGVTLLAEMPDSRVVATDASLAALRVAAANARRHRVDDRVLLVQTDLASAVELPGVDLVVSNPPYIGCDEAVSLSPEVRDFEPAVALFAGPTGHSLLARLLTTLADLRSGTPLLLEIGFGQAAAIAEAATVSNFALEELAPDLAGIERIARLRRR
jgi:release factor glutamine methyltransferase